MLSLSPPKVAATSSSTKGLAANVEISNDEADVIVRFSAVVGPNGVRVEVDKPKTGVPLGRTVVNPVNGEQIPMFVSDYVLMEYGTGAVMAVPAHDASDHAFAKAFDLEIREVVAGGDDVQEEAYVGDGPLVNSGVGGTSFNGLPNREALTAIVGWLDGEGAATRRSISPEGLADLSPALGCPIPIVHCGCGLVGVPAETCRSSCPGIDDCGKGRCRSPRPRTGSPRRARAAGRAARANTMDVRRLVLLPALLRPAQRRGRVGPAVAVYWMPVDRTSAASSTRSHLVRALLHQGARRPRPPRRPEPFARLFLGMITRDGANVQSKGNVVSRGDRRPLRRRHGTLPSVHRSPDQDADWSTRVEGVYRFLSRLWRLADEVASETSPARAREPGGAGESSARRTGRSRRSPTMAAGSPSAPRSRR
jgi:leucyl-tRNA synthetase